MNLFYAISIFALIFFMFVYWLGAFIILYHLIRFGVSGQPKRIAAVFLAGSLVLTTICLLLFSQINFSELIKNTSNSSAVINFGNLFPVSGNNNGGNGNSTNNQ